MKDAQLRNRSFIMLLTGIFILTAADVAFTVWGLSQRVIIEGNWVMVPFFQSNPYLAGMAILFLVFLGLVFLYAIRLKVKWLKTALWMICSVKLLVLGLHFHWIFLAFIL